MSWNEHTAALIQHTLEGAVAGSESLITAGQRMLDLWEEDGDFRAAITAYTEAYWNAKIAYLQKAGRDGFIIGVGEGTPQLTEATAKLRAAVSDAEFPKQLDTFLSAYHFRLTKWVGDHLATQQQPEV